MPYKKRQREGYTSLGNLVTINPISFYLQAGRVVKYSMTCKFIALFQKIWGLSLSTIFISIPKGSLDVTGHEDKDSGWMCITQNV